jgi:eukaryotic-like serine/threonine-protein kinase
MGEVYLATRDDQEYRKDVAIKVVRSGLESDLILRRFRHERQILANLEHPNIAGLLDGGTTHEGLPYFVMEYVDGLPIDAYSDTRRLSIRERLTLFRTVCSAVEHAHEHHVVHRDIKPTNILVTAEGVPKLLDFGIAKLLTSDGATSETVTRAGMLTPEFASPEQMRGESVNEAADIYALGVLLYRLLTGRSPYPVTIERPHELARAICEDEPVRPSTAIATGKRAAAGSRSGPSTPEKISGTRGETIKLRRQLSGDLDSIALKALRKEPQQRYASVREFSEDVGRYLEGRPRSHRAGRESAGTQSQ